MKRTTRTLMAAAMLSMLAPGCGEDELKQGCTPGAIMSCQCVGGGNGQTTCSATGTSWGPCVGCPGSDGGVSLVDSATGDAAGADITPPPDGSPPDKAKPDKAKPDLTAKPDLKATDLGSDAGLKPCPGSLYNDMMQIGDSKTVNSGSKQVALYMQDIGVSGGSVPAALLTIDGSLSIISVGQSEKSKQGFKVLIVSVQNQGTAKQRWAQVCVTYP